MNSRSEASALADIRWVFDNLRSKFESLPLSHPIGEVFLRVSEADKIAASAVVWPGRSSASVRVSEGFVLGVQRSVEELHEDLLATLLSPFGEDTAGEVEDLRDLVGVLSQHFLLLHEIAHILCGHCELGREDEHRINEVSPADVSNPTGYALELEADNTATEMLLEGLVFDDLFVLFADLARTGDVPPAVSVGELSGDERTLGFQIVLVSTWLVLDIVESARLSGRSAADYPNTGARLLSQIHTLLASFGSLSAYTMDPDGAGRARVEDDGATLVLFLRRVLADPLPFLPTTLLGEWVQGDNSGGATAALVADTAALLLGTEIGSESARQVNELQRVRSDLAEALAPKRYLLPRNEDEE